MPSTVSSRLSGLGELGWDSTEQWREEMCFFKVSTDEKVLVGHFPHLKGLSGTDLRSLIGCGGDMASETGSASTALADPPCFLSRCLSQLDLVVNSSGQCGHLKGFCPVWVSTWRRKDEDHGNLRWQ